MKIRTLSVSLGTSLLIAVTASGCLKTRAQLRDDTAAEAQPVPAQVQEVMSPQTNTYAIDEMKEMITRLQGRIEDLERGRQQQTTLADSTRSDEMKKIDQRLVELEQAQAAMLDAIKKLQANVPAPDAVDVFQKGKASYQSKDYDGAIASLSTYLKNPHGKHVEEATWLRGESYFHSKQFKKAIIDYSKFPEKYTKSRRMAAALYKIGKAFEALGMKDDAKSFYQELVDKYPKSSEAKRVPKAKLR